MAARYRSFTVHPPMLVEAKPQSTSREASGALVLRDLDAIFEQARNRRILASLIKFDAITIYGAGKKSIALCEIQIIFSSGTSNRGSAGLKTGHN